MQKYVFSASLILLLFPFSQGFSQEFSDNAPTLTLSLVNEVPYVYKDSGGYAVVVGAVENNNQLTAVSNVMLQVKFYDDFNAAPVEVVQGSTTLDVIPSNGKSTFSIRSENPDPNITQASVSLIGFDSSTEKPKGLMVYSSEISLGTELQFSGVLQNGGAPNTNTDVHLAFYDAFEPPRILQVSTVSLGKVDPNTRVDFEFNGKVDSRAAGFWMFAESNIFTSDVVDVKIPPQQSLSKLASISEVSVKDQMGNSLHEIEVGTIVNIESKILIEFAKGQISKETPYTYYVQIKESGKNPYVEFIGKYDGRFLEDGTQFQKIDWIPEKSGLYFIETFVWDRNNIPISEQGPFVLILVK